MNTKQRKRQRDIKTKLMAAICMLLVSSIMMVSTTYAWFTLSTAPEVTGIQTAVGSNGNLEMALLPENIDLTGNLDQQITSGEGDSMDAANKLVQDANVTWGNLVDVSDAVYGLSKITLNPAALNTTDVPVGDTQILGLANSILKTPAYGSDGRVTELKANTLTGVYNGSAFLGEETASSYGVRAVGTSSTMTERQLAHRDALTAAAKAGSQAITVASQSLKDRGNTLANVAIRHATSEKAGQPNYTKEEVEALLAAVNDLEISIGYIETAIKNYVAANTIADATDEAYVALKDNVLKADVYNLSAVTGVKVPSVLTGTDGYIAKLAATKKAVTDAKSGLSGLLTDAPDATHFKWEDFNTHLSALANADSMTVNSKKVSELTNVTGYEQKDDGNGGKVDDTTKPIYGNMEYLVDSVLGGQGLTLTLTSGAGVYADIADFCGDYSAKINIDQIQYQGLKVKNVEAKMVADGTSPTYLEYTRTGTAAFSGSGASTTNPISGYYGYIIDLAFRTNAADSFLQLQSDAVDRVYKDNTVNEDTMGGGSSMTFIPVDGFETTAMENLMESIRVVFFDPSTKAILGYARLDADTSAPTTNGGLTMKLKMYNADGTKKMSTTDSSKEDPTIVALEQNKAKAISVLVYLDGATVTNADVANGAYSMNGTMNLQFSSSATLVPMDYTDLKTGDADSEDGSGAKTQTIRPTVTKPDAVTVSNVAYDKTTGTLAFGVTGYDESKHEVTIAINGAAAAEATYNTTSKGVAGFTASVAANTEITSVAITVTDTTATGGEGSGT